MNRCIAFGIGVILCCGASSALDAQTTLATRVAAAKDGVVRFRFAGKPGVCGDGMRTLGVRRDPSGVPPYYDDFTYYSSSDSEHGMRERCVPGPVQVSLDVRSHHVEGLRTTAGPIRTGASSDVTDLGEVGAVNAAKFLLSLASAEDGSVGDHAIMPAVLADSAVIWPELLRIGRDERISRHTRKSAIFWLGQVAADAATAALKGVAENDSDDVEIRKQAVFALSQRPKDEGVPALISVVSTTKSREVKKAAIFWLAQTNDPRAIALFEKILTGR